MKKHPNHYFAWDDNIEVSEKQNDDPRSDPIANRLNEIASYLKGLKDEMERAASTRQTEMIQAITDSNAEIQKGMRNVAKLAGWTIVGIAVIIAIQWASHH
jgi:hypothetical protein